MRTYEILTNEQEEELMNEHGELITGLMQDQPPRGTVLSAFRDFIETDNLPAYLGKIPNAKQMCLGVYGLSMGTPVEAIGKESSYDITGFRLLVHGNKNATDTETTAREVYQRLRYVTATQMGDYFAEYIELDTSEPTFIGTDDNGVYEFHISGTIYYRR